MSAQHAPSNIKQSNLWLYVVFNLILLAFLALWFYQKNQPVALVEPALPASGKLQCVSYAPYYGKDQTPFKAYMFIAPAQIDQDLQLLSKRFECVRIYSVGQGLDYVPEAASKLGLKVYLGAWIGWTKADNDLELNLAIKLANRYPDTVKGLIVGNEVLLRREQTPKAMRAYLKRAQEATKVPVSYADVWEFWLKNKQLEHSVDFVTVHVLPYWEDIPQSIDQATKHANYVMDRLAARFSKPLVIGETGWPSVGRQREQSIPSQVNQARYVREFLQAAHDRQWNYNLIEAIDQPWKRVLEGTVGGYWGLYATNLQPKFGLNGPISERQDSWKELTWPIGGLFIFLLMAHRFGARKTGPLVSAGVLGTLEGSCALLQIEYLIAACRSTFEWAVLGGIVLIGWLVSVSIVWQIADISTNKSTDYTRRLQHWLLLCLLGGSLICSSLILIDGRYRDFPVILYLLPALQLCIARWQGLQHVAQQRSLYLVSGLAVITAFICWLLETGNLSALSWLFISILLAATAWPKYPVKPFGIAT